jgi:hypothetical protein
MSAPGKYAPWSSSDLVCRAEVCTVEEKAIAHPGRRRHRVVHCLGTGWASTYLAVIAPTEDASLLARQLALFWPGAVAWTLATTFLPEVGIGLLYRWLRE